MAGRSRHPRTFRANPEVVAQQTVACEHFESVCELLPETFSTQAGIFMKTIRRQGGGIVLLMRRRIAHLSAKAIIPLAAGVLLVGVLPAQEIKIWSEFQRIDPFGKVVAVDRVDHAREILSPAVARNAWASFHLAVSIAENTPSFLYVQQNPESFQITVYKEQFTRTADGWIPDRLSEVKAPCPLLLPDLSDPIPRQNTVVYWLDVWVPAKTAVGRVRVEAVLQSGGLRLVYPMEVRVTSAMVPKIGPVSVRLASVTSRADAFLKSRGRELADPASIRHRIRRNAAQDEALAGAIEVTLPTPPKELGAEGYLKVRDFLLR
jgi:hypothetical protein